MKARSDSLHGGEVFDRLTVVELSHMVEGKSGKRERVMKCKCSCGREVSVRTSNLKSGNTLSCGCVHKERTITSNLARTKINK